MYKTFPQPISDMDRTHIFLLQLKPDNLVQGYHHNSLHPSHDDNTLLSRIFNLNTLQRQEKIAFQNFIKRTKFLNRIGVLQLKIKF